MHSLRQGSDVLLLNDFGEELFMIVLSMSWRSVPVWHRLVHSIIVGECFFWYRLTRVVPYKFHRAVKLLCVCALSSVRHGVRSHQTFEAAKITLWLIIRNIVIDRPRVLIHHSQPVNRKSCNWDTYERYLMVFMVAQNLAGISLVISLHNIYVLILCTFGLITPLHSKNCGIFL